MAQAAPERRASVIRLVYLPPAGARQRARANHLTNTVGSVMGAVCGIGEFIGSNRIIIGFIFEVISYSILCDFEQFSKGPWKCFE